MIRITVELLPGGMPTFRRTIATMTIGNVSDLADRSDYHVEIFEGRNSLAGTAPRTCGVSVKNHDRRQSVWNLISAALHEAGQAEWDAE